MHLRGSILAATLAASVFLPFAARAQDEAPVEVRPGSPLLDPSRIIMRTDTFELHVEGADSIWLVTRTAPLGDTALLHVERISSRDREFGADSFAVRRTTLAPLFAYGHDLFGSSRIAFPPGRAVGTYTPADGEKLTIREALSAPLFYASSAALVLASLPLEAGRSFDLWTWTPTGLNGIISARVVGAETVSTADGARCTAWRVETEDENGQASVYWIEETTRSLLAVSTSLMQTRIVHHGACR